MVQYATPTELAAHLQADLDTASASQALTLASQAFSAAADTWFAPQAVTYRTTGTRRTAIVLPFHPVTAVAQVRVSGVVVTGWVLIGRRLFRSGGFGSYSASTPDVLEVDLTHGYATVPDDVKLAVLDMAAGLYENPTTAVSVSIDDYTERYGSGGDAAGRSWRDVATAYRGSLMA